MVRTFLLLRLDANKDAQGDAAPFSQGQQRCGYRNVSRHCTLLPRRIPHPKLPLPPARSLAPLRQAPRRRRWPSRRRRPPPEAPHADGGPVATAVALTVWAAHPEVKVPIAARANRDAAYKDGSRHCTSLPRMATQSHQDATCSRGQQGDQNGGKHHFTSLPGMAMQRSSRCSSQPTPTKMRLTEMVSRHCTPLPKRPCRGHQDAPCSRGQQRGG